jgi:hypothetical protein
MTDDTVRLLIQEVDDLLDAGEVGLYEFMWFLNNKDVEGSTDDHRVLARKALDLLLKENRGRLISLVWAQPGTEKDLDRDVRLEDFNDPQQDVPYVAITRD